MAHPAGQRSITRGIIAFAIAVALSLCFISSTASAIEGSLTRTQNPLVASYSVVAPAGSSVVVEFGPDIKYGFVTSANTVPAGATSIAVLVAGMKQNSTYHMRAITTLQNGKIETDIDRVFTTGAAPASRIPAMTVTIASGNTPAPGVELVGLNPPKENVGGALRVVALNPAGDLIWYYDLDPALVITQPIILLPNGDFLMVLFGGTTGPGGMVREINLAGQTIHQFTVDDLNRWLAKAGYTWTANAIHHDIAELPNGHLLLLVNSHKDFTNLPGHRGVTTVLCDVVVDLDANYKPGWVWSAFDHLDVNRHPMEFPDWTHTNAILYSPDDGDILLSVRHQHWILKIDYANGKGTGKILWRLGYQGDFKLLNSTSPADWFYAPHFASFVSPNTTGDFQLALFDNGNNRVLNSSGAICSSTAAVAGYSRPAIFTGGAPACYSRPAIFEVNESARTAQLLWSRVVPFSSWGGVTLELPNDNIFFDIARLPDLIDRPAGTPKPTLKRTLLEELAIVILVVLIFSGRLPTVLIPVLTIPIALVLAFAPILGGIAVAIGIFVDATVVVFGQPDTKPEPSDAEARPRDYRRKVIAAMKGVGRPSFFGLLVIGVSFLPMFTPLDDPTGARVMEVTQQKPPQTIWELSVSGQESYRTIHVPSLYPGVKW